MTYVPVLRGILTLGPVEGVREIPTTSTVKESRFVPGGGISGVATKVTLTVALPPPQLVVQGPLFTPLQEVRNEMEANTASGRKLRNLIEHPVVFVQT